MARPNLAQHRRDEREGPSEDWQALRADLVALLDQVDGRASGQETDPRQRVQPAIAEREEAVRSLQRTLERHTGRHVPAGMAANPQSVLDAAVREIRSRTGGSAASAQRPDIAPTPLRRWAEPVRGYSRRGNDMERWDGEQEADGASLQRDANNRDQSPAQAIPSFEAESAKLRAEINDSHEQSRHQIEDLSRAVAGIAGRLERFEAELRASRENGADVAEIGRQVAQLTGVVEVLAGAVGETGQIKHLEDQITRLTRSLAEGTKSDISALTLRIDEVAASVDRLAEMQAQHLERPSDKNSGATKDTLGAIEESVRAIYDRIDTLESSLAISPQDVERLTAELASFTENLRENGAGGMSPDLLERLDKLDSRLDQIEREGGNSAIAELRTDVTSLRDLLGDGFEPRFAALESQIDALSGRIASGSEADGGQLEQQIRQLVARMDETGEQLDGLTRLYIQDEKQPAPDLEKLANMVALRTSEEMARTRGSGLSEDGLAALEDRLSRLFEVSSKPRSEQELADVHEGIKQVDARLDRLEAALSGRPSAQESETYGADAPTPTRAAEAFASLKAKGDFAGEAYAASAGKKRQPKRDTRRDSMPANPSLEAPLVDMGFSASLPVDLPSSQEKGLDREAIATDLPAEPEAEAEAEAWDRPVPTIDPENVERPAKPKSRFAEEETESFAAPQAQAMPVSPAQPEPVRRAGSDRDTFIAAARRAVQKQAEAVPDADTGTLIGRAFARLQRKETEAAEDQRQDGADPRLGSGRHSYDTSDAFDTGQTESGENFFKRHRRPLVLAAALVAVSLLALNLVNQRLNAPAADGVLAEPATSVEQPAPEAQPATEDVSSLESSPGTSPIRMIDPQPTGSIDPFAKVDLSSKAETTQTMPVPLQQFAASGTSTAPAASPAPGTVDQMPTASIAPQTHQGPVKLDLPPENVGPLGLRQAAADGDARAQFEIAAIYTEGRTVEQDYKQAAAWYERSGAQGFAPAEYRLGTLYENGRGVEKDLQLARLWYQRAAEAGNRMAMHNLAALYAGGGLGTQDFAQAAQWFTSAAQRGMTDSQFNLGMLYARGLGVPQSLTDSYKWFSLAAAQGDKDAGKARDDVARSLSADQIQDLQQEIASWRMAPIDIAANFAPLGTWAKDFDPGKPIGDPALVKKVQAALSKLGYDVGIPDGLIGPQTEQAIKDFEHAAGMTQVGKVNPRLLAVLGSQPV